MKTRALMIALIALAGAVPATGAPQVMAGWPVPVEAGSVHPGPSGGVVVFNDGLDWPATVSAFRLDGSRRWLSVHEPTCGNCVNGPIGRGLRADGNYGPIGPTQDDIWDVTPAGRRVAACRGTVRSDETCLTHEVRFTPAPAPAVVARRGSSVLWTYEQPTLRWSILDLFDVRPAILERSPGNVYTWFGSGLDTATGATAAQQLVALDGATGALRWRALDATPQAALTNGVIATTPATPAPLGASNVVHYAGDGTVRWMTALATGSEVRQVSINEAQDRAVLLVGQVGVRDTGTIVALRLSDGAQVWRSAAGPNVTHVTLGARTAYLATERIGTQPALVAVDFRTGRARWRFETPTPVVGARELRDGTVAFTTLGLTGERNLRPRQGRSTAGLLWRIDPKRRAARPRHASFALASTRWATRCDPSKCTTDGSGTVLRISVPTRTSIGLRLLTPSGRLDVDGPTFFVPAGVSYVRVFSDAGRSRSVAVRRILQMRGSIDGRRQLIRIPVTITPPAS